MSAPTRSEILVLDALAQELRSLVPDLDRQAARAVVDRRDNTGSGVFTQFKLDRRQTGGADGATGLYGSIHGDWPGFSSPVAFQAVLSGGRLQGLRASTYDESTLGLNVAAAPVSNLFRIDASGRSVPVAPKAADPSLQSARGLNRAAPGGQPVRPLSPSAAPAAPSVPVTPARIQAVPAPAPIQPALPDAAATAPMAALIGVATVLALVLYFTLGLFGLVVLGFIAARAWSHKPTRETIQRALSSAKARSGCPYKDRTKPN